MHLDLLDVLRCPAAHAPSALVAAVRTVAGRDLHEGVLGCPVCRAEFPVRDGVLHLGPPGATADPRGDAERLAALLGVDDAPGVFVVEGAWGVAAAALAPPAARLVVLDGGAAAPLDAIVGVGATLPFGDATIRGVALDGPARGEDAFRTLRPGGRLIAPAATPVPAGAAELARDEADWVAERPALGRLARAPRPR